MDGSNAIRAQARMGSNLHGLLDEELLLGVICNCLRC